MLQLKNIRKSYDSKVILDSISLDINDGEIVSILGPSGSGKTTLLNAILGLTEIDGGQIIFDGKDLTNVPMKDRGFNIVFQDYALFPNLDVQHNVLYGLKNRPNNDFVRKFILNQLEIKRNNIYALFAARQRSERWCNAA